MGKQKKYLFWFLASLLCQQLAFSQDLPSTLLAKDTLSHDTDRYVVGKIFIEGNKKTKQFIILREIPFKEGEQYTMPELVKKFEDARRQLMNTVLFHSVVVSAKNFEENKTVNVLVDLKERWYLFPTIFFKPVDRNLNQWLVDQHGDLSRVNYGLRLHYYNATGINDKLRALVGIGYTRQLALSYDRLYIDKKLKWGMGAGFSYGKNKEVNYNTVHDKQAFVKDDDLFLSNFTNVYLSATYRRKIKTIHSFGIEYSSGEVQDTIISLNPSYFKNGARKIHYPGIYYNMTYFDLDYIPYPTKGYAVDVSLYKQGFSSQINLWQIGVRASGSWHLPHKAFFTINVYGGLKLPFKQPYFIRQFLGYGDVFLQGYEYYVIDGVAGGYLKATVFRDIFKFNIRVPPIKKGKEITHIPIRFVGKIYGNTGYVHNPEPGNNLLSNKMLYSGGFGIDIVTFYDITFKLEYSFNQLGENGLFLHRKSIF